MRHSVPAGGIRLSWGPKCADSAVAGGAAGRVSVGNDRRHRRDKRGGNRSNRRRAGDENQRRSGQRHLGQELAGGAIVMPQRTMPGRLML